MSRFVVKSRRLSHARSFSATASISLLVCLNRDNTHIPTLPNYGDSSVLESKLLAVSRIRLASIQRAHAGQGSLQHHHHPIETASPKRIHITTEHRLPYTSSALQPSTDSSPACIFGARSNPYSAAKRPSHMGPLLRDPATQALRQSASLPSHGRCHCRRGWARHSTARHRHVGSADIRH